MSRGWRWFAQIGCAFGLTGSLYLMLAGVAGISFDDLYPVTERAEVMLYGSVVFGLVMSTCFRLILDLVSGN